MEQNGRESNMWAAARSSKNRNVGHSGKALIAAYFEDCRETLRRLHSTCLGSKAVFRDIDTEYVGELLAFVNSWGEDTGAHDHSLDRRLRLSKNLQRQTVDLLKQLQSGLQKG
jgi:hypothetical protein